MSQDAAAMLPAIEQTLTIVSVIVGAATVYLRIYVGNRLSASEKSIIAQVKAEFAQRDLTDMRFAELGRRIEILEKT